MIVHLIGSKSQIEEDIKYFRDIKRIVEKNGHTLGRDWIEEVYAEHQNEKQHKDEQWKDIFHENIAAMAKADVVIAEATAKSFSIGYQVATALQQKKPVLILTRNNSLGNTLGSGIASDFVQFANYEESTLEQVIVDFLKENTVDTKDLRFNFFIDRQIYNYLRWASYKTGKTKAEILRELVDREIKTQQKV